MPPGAAAAAAVITRAAAHTSAHCRNSRFRPLALPILLTAVDAVMGSRHPPPAEAQQVAQQIAAAPSEPCAEQAKKFTQCMEAFDGDMGPCQVGGRAAQHMQCLPLRVHGAAAGCCA